MGRRSRQRGRNQDQIAKKQLTHQNYQHRSPTITRHRARPCSGSQFSKEIYQQLTTGFNQPRSSHRSQHQYSFVPLTRSFDHHSCLLKSRRAKKKISHHLNLALAEVYRWNVEERPGNDEMDWQPENEVVIPQINNDVVYFYGISPSSSTSSTSSQADPAQEFPISEKASMIDAGVASTTAARGYQPQDLQTGRDPVVLLHSDKLGQSVSGLCESGINNASDTGILSSGIVRGIRVSLTWPEVGSGWAFVQQEEVDPQSPPLTPTTDYEGYVWTGETEIG